MDARKHLIIIKGKDQTESVASFQFHDGKCEVVYTSAPNKTYSFQISNVEILPLQKKIHPAQVIVTANGQVISEIDELLDFGGYYRIVRNGKKDLSFRRSEVQFQQNCLTDDKNQEAFQYFKETAAAISLEVEGINILSMLQGGERMKYKLLKDLYDCFCTPPELQAQKQEIDECHQALSKVLGKLERRLVLQIIDAKDRIAEETSIDSFIAGFELAWKLSVELNHYENERSVSCQTAMGSGARFASKEEEK